MAREPCSRADVLEVLQELIRTPSVNPSLAPDEGRGEEPIAKVAQKWLAANRVKSWLEEAAAGRPDTIAEVRGGQPSSSAPIWTLSCGDDDSAV
jgi:acetylornithine deacetylase/succinyl-diaminopimelate desuccinylase-like protein